LKSTVLALSPEALRVARFCSSESMLANDLQRVTASLAPRQRMRSGTGNRRPRSSRWFDQLRALMDPRAKLPRVNLGQRPTRTTAAAVAPQRRVAQAIDVIAAARRTTQLSSPSRACSWPLWPSSAISSHANRTLRSGASCLGYCAAWKLARAPADVLSPALAETVRASRAVESLREAASTTPSTRLPCPQPIPESRRHRRSGERVPSVPAVKCAYRNGSLVIAAAEDPTPKLSVPTEAPSRSADSWLPFQRLACRTSSFCAYTVLSQRCQFLPTRRPRESACRQELLPRLLLEGPNLSHRRVPLEARLLLQLRLSHCPTATAADRGIELPITIKS